jgi:phospholipid/cholesterol/gamma-HCH transport system substrate-binding protein
MRPTERIVRILTGLITLVVMMAVTIVAVEYASGHFDNTYRLTATFDAAGQGLIQKSDVKVRGFTIGEVAGVHLRRGRAVVTMRIQHGERVPVAATATIRPKTLFGEKFVDVNVGDERPPFLRDGGVIRKTVGGFELERVLTDAEPVLRALDPADVATVFGTLADGSKGEGEHIGHQIVAQSQLAEVFARHADDTRRFLDDFDRLTAALEAGAPDLEGAAQNLNAALPELNAQATRVGPFLDGVADLSQYLAEVLEANQSTLVKAATKGGDVLQVLSDKRGRIAPLLVGLREFFQAVAEAGSYDGTTPLFADPEHRTHLAAVKFVVGGGSPTGGASASSGSDRRASLRGTSAITRLIARTLGAPIR